MENYDEWRNLFLQTLSNETVNYATEILSKIYADPANMEPLIDFLSKEPDRTLRMAAIYGISLMIKQHWGNYRLSDQGSSIQQFILKILMIQTDYYLIENLVSAISMTLKDENSDYTAFYDFILQSFENNNLTQIYTSILLLIRLKWNPLSYQCIISSFNWLVQQYSNYQSFDDISNILKANFVLYYKTYFLLQPETLDQLFPILYEFFCDSVLKCSSDSFVIARCFYKSFSSENRISEPISILVHLFELIDQADQALVTIIAKVIEKFIIEYYDHVEQLKFEIINKLFSLSEKLFTDECFSFNMDSVYVLLPAKACFRKMDRTEFWEFFLQLQSPETVGGIFSYLALIMHTITDGNEIIFTYLPSILEIIQNYCEFDNHSIQEISLACLFELLNEHGGSISKFIDPLFEITYNKLFTEHSMIHDYALKCIIEIFNSNEINPNNLNKLLGTLFTLVNSENGAIQADALCAISLSIKSLDIQSAEQFAENIYVLAINGINNEDKSIESRSIELLGSLILKAPNFISTKIEETFSLLNNALSASDSDVMNSVLLSLCFASKSSLDIDIYLHNSIERVYGILVALINNELTGDGLFIIEAVIYFFYKVAKYRIGILSEYINNLVLISADLMKIFDEDIFETAAKFLIQLIHLGIIENTEALCKNIIFAIESDNQSLVKSVLDILPKLLDCHNCCEDFVDSCQIQILKLLKGEHPCQEDEKLGYMFYVSAYKCLSDMIKKYSIFRIEEYIVILSSIKDQMSLLLYSLAFEPLADYVDSQIYSPNPYIFELALTIYPKCDGKIYSFPIDLLRNILIRHPDEMREYINDIISIIKLNIEKTESDDLELMTKLSCVNLVIVIFFVYPDSIPQEAFNNLLPILPLKDVIGNEYQFLINFLLTKADHPIISQFLPNLLQKLLNDPKYFGIKPELQNQLTNLNIIA